MPLRVRHALRGFWRLSDIHGLSRQGLRARAGMGKRSLAHLEEVLAAALGNGFELIPQQDWHQPGLPGIGGRPTIEVLI